MLATSSISIGKRMPGIMIAIFAFSIHFSFCSEYKRSGGKFITIYTGKLRKEKCFVCVHIRVFFRWSKTHKFSRICLEIIQLTYALTAQPGDKIVNRKCKMSYTRLPIDSKHHWNQFFRNQTDN